MCIIAAKPAGVGMPDNTTLRNMWDVNSDGAGFMYVENGTVKIEKGFMKYKNFIKAIEKVGKRLDMTATPVVMHFRITTHGGTKPENTHPFPITESVGVIKKLNCTTDVGVAHNGIIPITPRKEISDTMEYVISQLAPLKKALPRFYENKFAMQLISNAIESKMAFLTKDGKIYTIGDFIEDNGMMYSNYSYEKYYSRYTYGKKGSSIFDSYYPSSDDGEYDSSYFYDDGDWVTVSWLDDDSYLMSKSTGELYSSENCLIDDSGNVYMYDYEHDSVTPISNYTAHTQSGAFATLNDDEAMYMPITPVSLAN